MTWVIVSLMVVIVALLSAIAAILNYGFAQVFKYISVSARDNRDALEGVRDEVHAIGRRVDRITNGNVNTDL